MSSKYGVKRVLNALYYKTWAGIYLLASYGCMLKTKVRMKGRLKQRPHGLDGELIVSLTSYTPRFATLQSTLECLLTQGIRPDRVILWVAHEDYAALPPGILALTHRGLDIQQTDDIGSYKKIIPTLRKFPHAFIATADDDLYYRPGWLEELLQSWNGRNDQIVCHRAHLVLTGADDLPLPYNHWRHNAQGPGEMPGLFPVGVGGIFYPPGSLAPEVLDEAAFLALSPKADDVWLYWMARRARSSYKKTAWNGELITWPGSQRVALRDHNTGQLAANDIYIKNLIETYGWPAIG